MVGPHPGVTVRLQLHAHGQGVALGRLPMIAEHLRDRRLVAPFPKKYDSARGYFAIVAPRAADRDDVRAFLRWLTDEAARETVDAAPALSTTRSRAKR